MSGLVYSTPGVPRPTPGREGHDEGAPVSMVDMKSSIRTVMLVSDIAFSFP